MNLMTHKERVIAAINKEEVDRIPLSIWYHMPHKDQDAIALAEEMIRVADKYDFDFIKMCPYGNYVATDYGLSCNYFCTPTQPVKERFFRDFTPSQLAALPVFAGTHGTYGKTLQIATETRRLLKEQGLELPILQTIFNPLTVLAKLVGMDNVNRYAQECPNEMKAALEAITETQINFINANIEAGVDGFFYASQTCREGAVSREVHAEFAEPYDIKVAKAYEGKTYFNVLHIHGDKTYWDIMAKYPGEVLNWHDRWIAPSMEEARKMSDKCFLGGINEGSIFGYSQYSDEEICAHIGEGIVAAGQRGLMVGPGCVARPDSVESHFYAARRACEKYAR